MPARRCRTVSLDDQAGFGSAARHVRTNSPGARRGDGADGFRPRDPKAGTKVGPVGLAHGPRPLLSWGRPGPGPGTVLAAAAAAWCPRARSLAALSAQPQPQPCVLCPHHPNLQASVLCRLIIHFSPTFSFLSRTLPIPQHLIFLHQHQHRHTPSPSRILGNSNPADPSTGQSRLRPPARPTAWPFPPPGPRRRPLSTTHSRNFSRLTSRASH